MRLQRLWCMPICDVPVARQSAIGLPQFRQVRPALANAPPSVVRSSFAVPSLYALRRDGRLKSFCWFLFLWV